MTLVVTEANIATTTEDAIIRTVLFEAEPCADFSTGKAFIPEVIKGIMIKPIATKRTQ